MWLRVTLRLFIAALTIPMGLAETNAGRVLLPIEVLGRDGTTESRAVTLEAGQSGSIRSLWLRVHGLRYPEQASVQVNASAWIPLKNDTVKVDAPGRVFGGIGGGFATLTLTMPLANGTAVAGTNTVRFRFNQSDGLSSGYRVLAWNFLTAEGAKVVPAGEFLEDAPDMWSAPLPGATAIATGKYLWHNAPLVASNRPRSPSIQARCADCHALDGRDLKYFNFSNASIVTRSQFHGLTKLQGEEIASYIRSLALPNPGRPWNPPYQPGPGTDEQPISNWAAGAGLDWVLDQDGDALPYLVTAEHGSRVIPAAWHRSKSVNNMNELARQITPEVFWPDGNLNPREIPIVLQLPDWSQWLPRVHPKDAWGPAFAQSKLATLYDGSRETESKPKIGAKAPLRELLAAGQAPGADLRAVLPAFTRWSQARNAFLARFAGRKAAWTPELSNKVYSLQLWQLVKTWELMQESGVEGRGRELFGSTADSRTWCNTVPEETAPAAAHIPNGPAGVGGSPLTNEYLTASWYELQIVLNSGNHQHRDRRPVDWVYLIHEFHDLYDQTHEAEPARLLVAVTKALQSSDPHLGPEDYSEGWRPDRNIDPRIMVSPEWTPMFKPLPREVRRAVAESLLAAWMDKNLQYPITKYLSLPVAPHDSSSHYVYPDISGGKTWQAAEQFRAAGVSEGLVDRLQNWGLAYTDRAARLQYH